MQTQALYGSQRRQQRGGGGNRGGNAHLFTGGPHLPKSAVKRQGSLSSAMSLNEILIKWQNVTKYIGKLLKNTEQSLKYEHGQRQYMEIRTQNEKVKHQMEDKHQLSSSLKCASSN